MSAINRFDGAMRELVFQRFDEFEKQLSSQLVHDFTANSSTVGWRESWDRHSGTATEYSSPLSLRERARVRAHSIGHRFNRQGTNPDFGPYLAAGPAQEDVNRLMQKIGEKLAAKKLVQFDPDLFDLKFNFIKEGLYAVGGVLGVERPTLFTEMFKFIDAPR